MLKMFSRVNRNRKSADYGKVELKVLSVEPPNLGISHLVSNTRCIHPVYIDGVSGVCGNLAVGTYVDNRYAHGWLCPVHYLRSTVGEFTSRLQALEHLDRDNIAYIIAEDRKWIDNHEDGGSVYPCGRPKYNECTFEEAAAVVLAPFRGWHPYLPKVSGGVHDHVDPVEDDDV